MVTGRHCEGRGRDGECEFPGAHAEDLHRQRALVSAPFVFCACSPGLVVKGCPACVCFPKRAGLLAFGLLLFVLHDQRSNQFYLGCCFPCPVLTLSMKISSLSDLNICASNFCWSLVTFFISCILCWCCFSSLSCACSFSSSLLLVLELQQEANSSAASDTHVQLDRAAVKGFNLVSPFLPPETREKITMLGSGDFLPELLEWCEVRGRALIQAC